MKQKEKDLRRWARKRGYKGKQLDEYVKDTLLPKDLPITEVIEEAKPKPKKKK